MGTPVPTGDAAPRHKELLALGSIAAAALVALILVSVGIHPEASQAATPNIALTVASSIKSVKKGTSVTHRIRVMNTVPGTATAAVDLAVDLPSGVTTKAAAGSVIAVRNGGSCVVNAARTGIRCTMSGIRSYLMREITLPVVPEACGNYQVTAQATSNGMTSTGVSPAVNVFGCPPTSSSSASSSSSTSSSSSVTVDLRINGNDFSAVDVAPGSTVTVSWSAAGAAGCTGIDYQRSDAPVSTPIAWKTSKSPSGSETFVMPPATCVGGVFSSSQLNFGISCTGQGGTATDNVQATYMHVPGC